MLTNLNIGDVIKVEKKDKAKYLLYLGTSDTFDCLYEVKAGEPLFAKLNHRLLVGKDGITLKRLDMAVRDLVKMDLTNVDWTFPIGYSVVSTVLDSSDKTIALVDKVKESIRRYNI